MRFDYENILGDYLWLKDIVLNLPNEEFPICTPAEVHAEKSSIIAELHMDASFKLLTRLEAHLKGGFLLRIDKKHRDELSRRFQRVVRERRDRDGDRTKPLAMVAEDVGVNDILIVVRDHFRSENDSFHRDCSQLKGCFSRRGFRNWYAHGRSSSPRPQVPDPEYLKDVADQVAGRLL